MKSLLICLGLAAAIAPLRAETLSDLAAKQQAVVDTWERLPLQPKRAIFVTEKPALYGAYNERPTNVFKPGEPILTYVELVGYTWKPVENGSYQFGVISDVLLKKSNGEIIGGKERFVENVMKSHARVQDLMINLTLTVSNAAPGDYTVVYTMHDANSDKTATIVQPFTIAK